MSLKCRYCNRNCDDTNNKGYILPRVRIQCEESRYFKELGYIEFSNCDGTFHIRVSVEGLPEIDLLPSEVEPC